MDITSTKPVSLAEVKEILEKREKDAPEGKLEYEQSQALEHARRFAKFDREKSEKIVASITKNSRISLDLAFKIVDVKPVSAETLKAIVLKDKVELTEDEVNEIFKALQ
ncbi:MAG: hypothetical protein Q7S22_04825 [Candidatus Micrarchaeota archaeon]|nr:hypothetical protein [Candidatus Micrarchaeota archaeon]